MDIFWIIILGLIYLWLLHDASEFIKWYGKTFSQTNRPGWGKGRCLLPRGGSFRSLKDKHERDWKRLDAMDKYHNPENEDG